MKKTIAILTALVMVFSLIPVTGVAFAEETDGLLISPAPETVPMAGGWTKLEDTTITAEAQAAFDKAMEGFVGSNVVPKELLATQVVAGINYLFSCEVTGVYPGAVTEVKEVKVYKDLAGNCTIIFPEDEIRNTEEPAQIVVSSKIEKSKKTGKKGIRLTWKGDEGRTLDYDKYVIYRATSKNGKYTKIYTTKKTTYLNTKVTAGKKYYYKVKGYKTLDGEPFNVTSNKACRTVK